jgi:hypothetical protein
MRTPWSIVAARSFAFSWKNMLSNFESTNGFSVFYSRFDYSFPSDEPLFTMLRKFTPNFWRLFSLKWKITTEIALYIQKSFRKQEPRQIIQCYIKLIIPSLFPLLMLG